MDILDMKYNEYFCKKCFKKTLYGFSYCAWCELKRIDENKDKKQFSYPKFGRKGNNVRENT